MTDLSDSLTAIAKAIGHPLDVELELHSFSHPRDQISDLIARCVASKTIFTDTALHQRLLDIRDTDGLLQVSPEAFIQIVPLLQRWLTVTSRRQAAFTLLHEGVRLFSAHVFLRPSDHPVWCSTAAVLGRMEADPAYFTGPHTDQVRQLRLFIEHTVGA